MIQIAELAYQASMLVWAVAGLVLLPLLAVCGGLVLFHKTRAYGGVALWLFSWLVGLSTWLLGAAFTFGWIGLIVGLLLFGIGVVPLGVFGAVWQEAAAGDPAPCACASIAPSISDAYDRRSIGSGP